MMEESIDCSILGPINCLPNEVLEYIFEHLNGESLLAARQVCKRWNEILLHAKKGKKSFWCAVYHKNLIQYSSCSEREFKDYFNVEEFDSDYWLQEYSRAVAWKRAENLEPLDTAYGYLDYIVLLCIHAAGGFIATGHGGFNVKFWNANSCDVILALQLPFDGEYPRSFASIFMVEINEDHQKVPECDDWSGLQKIDSRYCHFRANNGATDRTIRTAGIGQANEKGANKNTVAFYVYFLCNQNVYRSVFFPATADISSPVSCCDSGDIVGFKIKGDLLICWSEGDAVVHVYKATKNALVPFSEIGVFNLRSESISSVEIWGRKIIALVKNGCLRELDLSQTELGWRKVTAVHEPKRSFVRLAASYQYSSRFCLGITENKDVWIAFDGSAYTLIDIRSITNTSYGATALSLLGNLLAVGTDGGTVIFFYFESKAHLLDSKHWHPMKVIQVTGGPAEITSLITLDGGNPIVVASTMCGFISIKLRNGAHTRNVSASAVKGVPATPENTRSLFQKCTSWIIDRLR